MIDRRKIFVAAASAAVLLMPAHSAARPDVPVESRLTQGAGAEGPQFASSTGTLTQQILQSIRHWQEQPRVVPDGINAPATASAAAERLTPPPLSGQVEPWRSTVIRTSAHLRGEVHAS